MTSAAGSAQRGITRRLGRPGVLYNLGNVLGLVSGIAVATIGATMASAGPDGIVGGLADHLAGSPAAILTTLATAIFLLSGEAYERGYASGRGSFLGDLLSGIGAVALGAALAAVGNPLLAATAGGLSAGGKFGSATLAWWPPATPAGLLLSDLCRIAVLASRVPAAAVAASQLVSAAAQGRQALDLVLPVTMLACLLLWSLADAALLLQASRSAFRPVPRRL